MLLLLATAALLLAATGAFLVSELATHSDAKAPAPGFLTQALGRPHPAASLVRRPAPGLRIAIRRGGYTVADGRFPAFSLTAAGVRGTSGWHRYQHGARRRTSFGAETVLVGHDRVEQFLTVAHHLGKRTWRWQLGGLAARFLADGSVSLRNPDTGQVTGMVIEPVRVLDTSGHDVTPHGLRWSLGGNGTKHAVLQLTLDDSKLPASYVIDPITIRGTPTHTTQNNSSSTTLTLTTPTGVAQYDVLVAEVVLFPNGVNNITITAPSGWNLIRRDTGQKNGPLDEAVVATYYKVAGASEPSTYDFTLGTGKAANGGIVAYDNVEAGSPIDANYGATNVINTQGTGANVTGISTNGTNRVVLYFEGNSSNRSMSTWPTLSGTSYSTSANKWSQATVPGTAFSDLAFASQLSSASTTLTALSGNAYWAAQAIPLAPDVTPPTTSLSTTPVSGSSLQTFVNDSSHHYRLYYAPTGSGSFTVTNTASDSGGVSSVNFPAVSVTGFSGSVLNDTTSPFTSNTYSFDASNTTAPGDLSVVATDGASNTQTDTVQFVRDVTAPSGGAVTVNGTAASAGGTSSYLTSGSTVTINSRTDYTETQSATASGLATSTLTMKSATLSNNSCGTYGSPTTVTGTTSQSVSDGNCYLFTLTGTDNVGNAASITTTVKVDETKPANSISIGSASNASYDSGSGRLYFKGNGSGSFTFGDTLTDSASGPAQVSYPAIGTTGWTHGSETVSSGPGYTSSTYTWSSGASTPSSYSITGQDNAGNQQAASVTFVNDTTAPTGGAVTVNGTAASAGGTTSWLNSGTSVAINSRTDYTESLSSSQSGLASSTLTIQSATLSSNSCGSYGSASTISGTTSQTVSSGHCYLFTLTGTDNVGNATSITTTVKVDTTAPSAPTGFSFGSPTNAYWPGSGSKVYFKGGTSGGFTVTASGAADADSDIASYTYPALGSGWSNTAGAYTFNSSAGTQSGSVTATNNAGLGGSGTSFTAQSDTTAPTGGAFSANGVAATGGGSTSTITSGTTLTIDSRTDYGETQSATASGLASSTLTIQSATLGANSCGSYGSPSTISGTTSQTVASGNCYLLTLTGTDNVGNTSTVSTVVKVDTTAPTLSLSFANATGGAYYPGSGSLVYVRNNASGSGGFDVTATAADADTGIASTTFPTAGAMGTNWSVSGSGATRTYSYSAGAATPGAQTVSTQNNAGTPTNAGFTVVSDTTAPTGGAFSANGVAATGGGSTSTITSGTTLTIDSRTDYGETQSGTASGLASSTLTISSATLSANSCGTYGSPSTISGTTSQTVASGNCYLLTLTGTDNVGNTTTVSTVVEVDTTAPSAPTLSLANTTGGAYYPGSGTKVYIKPDAATGAFDVTASSTDADTGIASYTFPTAGAMGTNWSVSGSGATRTYSYTSGAGSPGSQSVTATNNVGLTSAGGSWTTQPDSTAPSGGALTVDGVAASGAGTQSYSSTGSFTIGTRTDYTETQTATASGLASSTLTRQSASFSAPDTCGSFGSATTLSGTPAQSGLSAGCYRYTLTGTDNVGNADSISTVVKVDTSAPNVSLAFANATGGAYYPGSGSTVYFRPATAGQFDLTATGTDNDSGIASVAVPSAATMGTNWSRSGSGPYTYGYTATGGTPGSQTVTATNNAGASTDGSFTVSADTTAPTGGALTVNGVAAGGSTPVSYSSTGSFDVDSLTAWSETQTGTASGLASSTLTRQSASFTGPDSCGSFGTATTLSGSAPIHQSLADGCYLFTLTGTDNVGNAVSITTIVEVDSTAPSSPSLSFGNLSANAYYSAGANTLYIRPSAGGTFRVTATSSDNQSGIRSGNAGYTFASLNANGGSGFGETQSGNQTDYTFDGSTSAPSTARSVTANDNAGLTASSTYTVAADTTPPSTSVQCNSTTCAAWYAAAVTVSLSASDGGSGLDVIRYTTDGSTPDLSNGTTYTGPFSVSSTATVKYRAYDRVGNAESVQSQAVNIDGSLPSVSLTAPADGSAIRNGAAVTATASAGAAGVQQVEFRSCAGTSCSWASGTTIGTDTTAPYGVTWSSQPADGQYTIVARATTNAGVTNDSGTVTVTVDNTAPSATMDDPGANVRGTVGLTSSTSDGGSGLASTAYEYANESDGVWHATPASWDTTGAADGVYDLRVTATDNAGNSTTSSAVTGVLVDNTAPTSSLDDPGLNLRDTVTFVPNASDGSGSGVVSVVLQSSPAGAGTWSAIGSSTTAPYWIGVDTTGLADGVYDFRTGVTDGVGNVGTSAVLTRRVDNTNPTGSITGPTGFVRGTVAVTSDSADAGSGVASVAFQRSPSGAGSWTTISTDTSAPFQASWDTTGLADGDYDLRAVTTDNAGNTFTSGTHTITVDNTAPTVSLDDPGANLRGTVTLSSTSGDGGSGIESVTYQRSPAGAGSWTTIGMADSSPFSYDLDTTALADGPYDLRAVATDAAGNQTTSAVVANRLVDNTAPTGSLTAPAAGSFLHATVTVSSNSADAGSGVASVAFQRSPAGAGTWTTIANDTSSPYQTGWDTTGLADGDYDLRAVTTDVAGTAFTSSTETVTVDNTAPTATMDDPGANLRGTVGLSSTTGDATSGLASVTYERSPAGADDWTAISGSSWDTTAEDDGLYDLRVVAADRAGNSTASAPVQGVRVDNTAPSVSLDDPGANVRGTVTLHANVSDSGSGIAGVVYEYSPAGAGTWTATPASWNTTALADGLYDLRATATDAAGNAATSTVVANVRVDNTAPAISLSDPGSPLTGTVSLESSPTDAGSGVDSVTYELSPAGQDSWTTIGSSSSNPYSLPWDTTSAGDGLYDLRAVVTDAAGNETTSASLTNRRVENRPPTVALTAPGSYVNAGDADPFTVTATATGDGAAIASVEFFRCSDASASCSGGSWASLGTDISAPYTASWPLDAEGNRALMALATDANGSTATATHDVTIDGTAPSGGWISYADGFDSTGSVTATTNPGTDGGSGLDAGSATLERDETTLSGGTCGSFPGSWSAVSSPDATVASDHCYRYRYSIADLAGNVTTYTSTAVVAEDAVAPTVSQDAVAANLRSTVTLSATASDGGGSGLASVAFQRSPAGAGTWTTIGTAGSSPYSVDFDTTGVADGLYDFRAVATDAAGNTTASAVLGSKRIDNTAPAASIDDPGANVRGTVTLSATTSDAGSGVDTVTFQYAQHGGSSWTATPAAWDTTALADGSYDLRAIVADHAGNSTTTGTVTTLVDNTAPTASIDDPGANVRGTVTLSATTGDAGSGVDTVTYEHTPHGGSSWTTTPAAWDTTALTDGSYDVRAIVTDHAGNSTTSDPVTTLVDNTAPAVSLTDPGASLRGTVTLASTATDAGSGVATVTFQRSPAGAGTWTTIGTDSSAPFAASFDTTGLSDGDYDLRAIATDLAGNTTTSATVDARTIDNTAPTASIDDPGAYARGTVTLSSTESDAGSGVDTVTYEYAQHGGSGWTATPAAWDTTALADGSYDLRAVVTDHAGNSTTTNTVTTLVDNTAPGGGSISYTNGYEHDGSADVTTDPGTDSGSGLDLSTAVVERDDATLAAGNCGSFGGSWSPVSVPDTTVADGHCYRYRYRVADHAGNVAVYTSAAVLKEDSNVPSAPALSFGSFTNASATGDTVYYRPGVAGGFTVTPTSSVSGGATLSYTYPDLGSGWTSGNGDYSYDGTPDEPGSGNDVVAVSSSGLSSDPTPFTVLADSTAPAGGSVSYADGWDTGTSIPVTLAAGVESGSGIPAGGRVLERASAPIVAGSCGVWSPFAPLATDPASPYSDSGTDGTCYRYRSVVTDAVGNTTTYTSSATVMVDTTLPAVSLGDPGLLRRGTISLQATSSDDGSGVASVRFDERPSGGGSWTPVGTDTTGGDGYEVDFDSTTVVDGTYDFRAVATDVAGNLATDEVDGVQIDNTPPVTSIISAPADPDNDATPIVSFDANEAGATFECRIDGGAWAACASPDTLTTLGDGSHTFAVRATDQAGNVDPTPPSHTWTVDTVPPSASLIAPAPYVRGTIGLVSNSSDPGGTGVESVVFELAHAGAGDWSTIPSNFDTTSVADGLYDFRVVATDFAGNIAASPAVSNVRIDNTKPTIQVTSPSSSSSVGGTVSLAVNVSDADPSPTVQFEVSPQGTSDWTPVSASWNTKTGPDAVPDGEYQIRATATDWAGNVKQSQTVADVLVDNQAPTVAITAPADGSYVDAAAPDPYTVVATADDADGSGVASVEFFACSTSDCTGGTVTSLGTVASAPWQATWPVPADGARAVEAVATDEVGHQSTAISAVTVDRTPPETTIETNPGDPTNAASPEFGFDSNDNTASFQCRLDAGGWMPCASPWSPATTPADGTHTVDVRAVDPAGNVDATPDSWTWLEDRTPPTASMDDPALASAAHAILGTVSLTSVEDDPGGANASGLDTVTYGYCNTGRDCSDAGNWAALPAGTSTWDTTAVDDGVYDLHVVVTDHAGNSTTSSPVHDVKVDNTQPQSAQDDPGRYLRGTIALGGSAADPSDPAGNDGSGIDHVDFQVSPAGAGSWTTVGTASGLFGPYSVSYDTTGPVTPDGLYDLRTIATDRAGNVESSSTPVTDRMVDNTPPTATMDDPGQYLRGTVGLDSTTSDPVVGGVASGIADVSYEYANESDGVWHQTPADWNTTSLPDGTYDLRVTAVDRAGNSTTSSPVTGRVVDNTKPVTTDDAPGGWQTGAVDVHLSASDSGSGVNTTEYSLDGGAWTAGATVHVPAVDGSHTVSYFSADNAGNVEAARTAVVLIDTTPPVCPSCSTDDYLHGTVTLKAHPEESGSGIASVKFEYDDGSGWSTIGSDSSGSGGTYSIGWDTTGVSDGPYHLRAVIKDEAGNTSDVDLHGGDVVVVDNTAPTVSLGAPSGGSIVGGSITIAAVASDANPLTYEFKVDGDTVASGSSPSTGWNTASHADGSVSITVTATDPAGNSATSAPHTVTIDNSPPSPTLDDPGQAVHGTITLSASSDSDTATVEFERSPAGAGTWETIASVGPPFGVSLDTTSLDDGLYDLRAIATDEGGHTGTSPVRTTRVDNTDPTGTLTAPAAGQTIGGPHAHLAASAADAGSGVDQVEFQYAPAGTGSWSTAGTAPSSPYTYSWDTTGLATGDYDLRIVVSDAAGNTRTTDPIEVHVDSTPPTVHLDDPGSPLSGSAALTATTTGADASSVAFAYSPAGASSWTTFATDGAAPWHATLDTTSLADGLYDLRATVSDSVGNTSTSVVAGVRVDNHPPSLLSSVPADGSVVTSASSIVLHASEAVTVDDGTLDGSTLAAPVVVGTQLTYNTGALSDGLHTLAGTLTDAVGNTTPFLVHFTVDSGSSGGSGDSGAGGDSSVAGNTSESSDTTIGSTDGLVRVTVPAHAWHSTTGDWIVISIDPQAPPTGSTGLEVASVDVDVTARWAVSGDELHHFDVPLEITFLSPPAGAIPATFENGTWRLLRPLTGTTLPDTWDDGYFVDDVGIHVLTRHLTRFALVRDLEAPAPPTAFTGAVGDGGLTLSWRPGDDNSGVIAGYKVFVDGHEAAQLGPNDLSYAVGPYDPTDAHQYTVSESDAAGNWSAPTQALAVLPRLAGLRVAPASAALSGHGFSLGTVTYVESSAPAGTVVGPRGIALAAVGSAVDVDVSTGLGDGKPAARFAFSVVGTKRLTARQRPFLGARIKATKPAVVTARLVGPDGRVARTWRLRVRAGASILTLALPGNLARPASYRVDWTAANGGLRLRSTTRLSLTVRGTRPARRVQVVFDGVGAPAGLARMVAVTVAGGAAFDVTGKAAANVQVIVVDADEYGLALVRQLHAVFPTVRLVVLSNDQKKLARAAAAGATLAVPATTPAPKLAALVAKLAR